MEALFAFAFFYLGLAGVTAAQYRAPGERRGAVGQCAVLLATLVIGLCWPLVYWRTLKADWDDYFLD